MDDRWRRPPVVLGIGLFLVWTANAGAQECDFCMEDGGEHWFDGRGALCDPEFDDNCFTCAGADGDESGEPAFLGCHTTSEPGSCTIHNECPELHLTAEVQRSLHASVQEGDANAIAEMLATHQEGLTLNVERQALQFRGCTGRLIGHLRLDSRLASEVALQRIAAISTRHPSPFARPGTPLGSLAR